MSACTNEQNFVLTAKPVSHADAFFVPHGLRYIRKFPCVHDAQSLAQLRRSGPQKQDRVVRARNLQRADFLARHRWILILDLS